MIANSFIAKFRQDWPTEYLAFEQLRSVDRTGAYAVIQGVVTQEESAIIVTQETERGFVLAYRYTSQTVLPGFRHNDIRGYLAAQLPQVPRALFYCLDLSQFTGEG